MKIIRRILPAALGCSLSVFVATAASAAGWVENEGGRMRMLVLPPQADGTVRGALQIEPKPGWITYWKEPGASGIPPQVRISTPAGPVEAQLSFPAPKQLGRGGESTIGYDHAVTLPLQFKLGGAGKGVGSQPAVSGAAFVGLCRNVCVPFQAEFTLALEHASQNGFETMTVLQAAAATLPAPPSADFAVIAHRLSDDRSRLSLDLKLPQADKAPQVIVSGPQGHVSTEIVSQSHAAGLYRVEMAVGHLPNGYDPAGKSWDLLVKNGDRAMETRLDFR